MSTQEFKTYTNLDVYNFILKIKKEKSLSQEYCEDLLNLLLEKGLDKPVSDFVISMFTSFLAGLCSFNSDDLLDLESSLSIVLRNDNMSRRIMMDDDGSYFVYPRLKGIPSIDDLLLYYSIDLNMSAQEIVDYLRPRMNALIKKLYNSKIHNYYGSPKYLILRTKAVCDAMEMLRERVSSEDREIVNSVLLNTQSLFFTMLNAAGVEDKEECYSLLGEYDYELLVTKEQYDFLKNCYLKILEYENSLVEISNKLWHSFAALNGGVFIHKLTHGNVESDEMGKICTSFYSVNANIIVNYGITHVGYAYPMDVETVFTVCETDVGSWVLSKSEFIEAGLPQYCQFDDSGLYYEYPHHSKLFPPDYIEQEVLEHNFIAEIIIDNRYRKVKPLYCFYTSMATEEEIREIKRLAEMQGLPVKYLEVSNEKSHKM